MNAARRSENLDPPSALTVRLHGMPVGTLSRLPGNTIAFLFSPEYAEDEHRPTLSLGYYNAMGQLRTQPETAIGTAPAFFANLLPEGDLRRYIAHRADVSPNDDFALLWVTGDDLPGAVTVHDPNGRPFPPAVEGGPQVEPRPEDTLRFSLAGVQLKFSAIDNARGGLTIRAQGRDGDWIVKLPSRQYSLVPENEYAMLHFANAVGIEIPKTRLIDPAHIEGLPEEAHALTGKALAVRRFDRDDDGTRIHIEDFNQVYRQPPRRKYENRSFANICQTVYRIMGNATLVDFIHRLVFNIGIGNNDMHLKNWSLIYRDRVTPSLTPAYDYVCTKVYLGTNDTGLSLGTARSFPNVTMDQVALMARRAGISSAIVTTAAREMVERMLTTWPTVQRELPFPELAATIDEQLTRIPLFAHRSIAVRGSAIADDLPDSGTDASSGHTELE